MSSVGHRGMMSNNPGAPHYFQKHDSGDAGEKKAAAAERRRSSAQMFRNLNERKRTSQDASEAARRASFMEQTKAPGFWGLKWQSWTKGTGK
ncbi:hypothetical protein JMJ35_001208 [Cladonia borealis]|uniref:Conidiation-specific expression protein n=1 Tax=Cladonia borealis TaxID=184061 RepID=A0AA39RA32_9LECA|nr:hypothetical protein JMJ35_001208 [Cladonia borealis]